MVVGFYSIISLNWMWKNENFMIKANFHFMKSWLRISDIIMRFALSLQVFIKIGIFFDWWLLEDL